MAKSRQSNPSLRRRVRIVSATKQLHLLNDGGWWDVTLAKVPTVVEEVKTRHGTRRQSLELAVVDSVIGAGLSKMGRAELYGRAGVYAVAKRQLSKKAMRDLKLR